MLPACSLGGLYYHHMLVVEVTGAENLIVIHYTGNQNQDYLNSLAVGSGVASASSSFSFSLSDGIVAVIKEESVYLDPKKQTVELLEYKEPNVAKYNGKEAIIQARSRVGDTSFNIFFKNCESFVNWAITGQEATNQGELAAAGLVAGGAAVAGIGLMTLGAPLMVGAGLLFLAGYLKGKSSSKKD